MAKKKIFGEKVVTFRRQLKNSELAWDLGEGRWKESGKNTRKKGCQQSQVLQI